MKWLGQHIWDFISRFRSDVYLEGTDSGTIASGGNLGLDSNNKVVKSASPSGTIDLASAEVTGTLPVGNGGTGATTLADNSILTGTGTSAITAESSLTYSGEILQIGNDDNGSAIIARTPHSDGDGGILGIFGGNATSGQTNKNGGDLQLRGGSPTGSGTFGDITFWSGDVEGSGTSLRAATQVAGAISTAATSTDFILYEKAGASTDDYFKISCAEHGVTTITTVDDNAAAANLDFVIDGRFSIASTGIDISGSGVISNAEWQGTAVASAYLDADTAHLTTDQTFTGIKQINARKFTMTSSTDNEYQGDITYAGSGTTTLGNIVYMRTDGAWADADADVEASSAVLLGIALGTDPSSHGILLRGMFTAHDDIGNDQGVPIYLSQTAGNATATAPSASGKFVRIIGYNLGDDDQMWFNPDSTYIEIA